MGYQPDFPFVEGGTRGYFKFSPEEQTIFGRIHQLMQTSPGERPWLCTFGVGLKRYLMEPLDEVSVAELKSKIAEQIARWEPGLSLVDLGVTVMDYGPPATVRVTVTVQSVRMLVPSTYTFEIGV